jgi:hypothetical protein
MSAEQESYVVAAIVCPHCGAELQAAANFCWLCGAKQVQPIPAAGPMPQGTAAGDQRTALLVAVAAVVAIGIGVLLTRNTNLLLLYGIAVVPTLIIVVLGSGSARKQGRPWSTGKTVAVAATTAATSVASALVMVLIVLAVSVLVVVAIFIALFVACIAALSGGHP